MKAKILFCFLLMLIYSCTNNVHNLKGLLNKQLHEHYSVLLSQYSHIVIIPRTGCHSCIGEADLFFEEHRANKDYLFIFTKLISEKQLRIELGADALSLKNVKIDKLNLFYFAEFIESEYPLLLKRESEGNYEYEILQ